MAATRRQRLSRMLGRLLCGVRTNEVFRHHGRDFEVWRFGDGTTFVVGVGEGEPRRYLKAVTVEELEDACREITAVQVMQL